MLCGALGVAMVFSSVQVAVLTTETLLPAKFVTKTRRPSSVSTMWTGCAPTGTACDSPSAPSFSA